MSGIEVAGLVLGAFPLLITALEHYRESAEVLSDWWKFKREYRKWKDEVRFHQLAFEQNLEKYLLPLIVDDDELQSLISDPGGERWRHPELEERLKTRLPRAYDLYISTIGDMNETMVELQKMMGVDKVQLQEKLNAERPDSPSEKKAKSKRKRLPSKTNLEYEFHRLKASFGKAERAKLFGEISHYNLRLKELLDTSDEISSLRATRRNTTKDLSLVKGLSTFWRHATNVFRLVYKAWKCDCSSHHRINLLLEHRTTISEIRFNLLLLYAQNLPERKDGCWRSLEAHISLVEGLSTSISEVSLIGLRSKSETTFERRPRSNLRSYTNEPSFSKTSTMIDSTELPPPAAVQKPSVAWEITPPPSRGASFLESDASEISNLCHSIMTCGTQEKCLGFVRTDEHCYVLNPVAMGSSPLDESDAVTLGNLLRKDLNFKLTRKQRFQVALTLASSQLQLDSTPWLQSGWSKDDIVFLCQPESARIDVEQPYISRGSNLVATAAKGQSTENSIPQLGMILLELCFNTAFENHEIRKKYLLPNGQSTPYMDLAAALEWCNQEAAEEAGPDFADAVKWCLGQFGSASLDETKRQELYEKVVKPLQFCHKQFEISSQM
ncbi:hypothetical protein EJ06DRAFT_528881 [Trichodelitschia bisporula]|uniref:DUF7580 domain-containing protein n=1 Tax=Trichodelitschia bisporula TaxID=703511 RepID=A0A6G1I0S8_9PEZI|nr:hypothetical protein EJ06DRAFT_528881 [Trichodelitschia bisporula]